MAEVDKLMYYSRRAAESETDSRYDAQLIGTYPCSFHYPGTPIEICLTNMKPESRTHGRKIDVFNRFMINVIERIRADELFRVRGRTGECSLVNRLRVEIIQTETVLELVYHFEDNVTTLGWRKVFRIVSSFEHALLYMSVLNLWAYEKGILAEGGLNELALNTIGASVLRSRSGLPNFEEFFIVLVKLATDPSRSFLSDPSCFPKREREKGFIHMAIEDGGVNIVPDANPTYWRSVILPELERAIRAVHGLDQSDFDTVATRLIVEL